MKTPCSLIVILLSPLLLVNAYTWQFTSPPTQCSNVSLSIQGSGGQPPYSLLIIPTGASPLPGIVEVRPILNIPFSGTSTTLSFTLNYPQDSSFVAVVSDKSGYGTGGTSTSITVLRSSDSSCYSTSKPWHPTWIFYIDPTGGLTQCESVRNWWEASGVDGTVSFYGTIPGGTSFTIPQGSLSTNVNTGTGFSWTVNIVAGTSVILIGNDAAGIGTGGYAEFTIGSTNNVSCIHDNSPSSTPGNPAGSYPTTASNPSSIGTGSYPTTSAGGSSSLGSGSHSTSSSHMGEIIGGVLGAAILLLVAFWLIRRRRSRFPDFLQEPGRPASPLQIDEEENVYHRPQFVPHMPQSYVTQSYVPEPYHASVPDRTDWSHPTTSGTSEDASVSTRDRLLSLSSATTGDIQSSQSPPSPPPKTQPPPPQARLNIIQHDDAGPGDDLSSQAGYETVELPPAYSNIRRQSQHTPPSLLPVAEDES